MRVPRLPGFDPRRPVEVAGGLMLANLGDLANILILSYFLEALVSRPEALALLPSLAALRGAIATSMASRVSTALHLGVLQASTREILEAEGLNVLALALAASVYAGLLVSALTGGGVWAEVAIAALSALMAVFILAPATAWIAAAGYRRGVDPDSVMAPILTILGDLTTVPTLLASALIVSMAAGSVGLMALALAYFAASLVLAVARGGGRRARRIVSESMLSILVVGALEAGTGAFLVSYTPILMSVGVLHAIPSIMEDTGAAASVLASKVSTLLHLEGPGGAARVLPAKTLETLAGSAPAMAVLAAIASATAPVAGLSLPLEAAFRIVFLGGLILIVLYSALASMIAFASHRLGLDPDNTVIPILTAVVDLATIPLIALLAPALL